MISIGFPNMFSNTVTNIVTDREATTLNLKNLILSNKNSLFGDPYFGINLKKYLFDPNDLIVRDILVDEIYTAIAEFIPEIYVRRDDISISSQGAKVNINISAINLVDFKTDLYNIVLFDTVV